MFQFIFAWLTAAYAELVAVGNLLETGELVLLGESLTEGGESEEADIVRPTFTGYADEAIAAFTPAVDGEGVPYLSVAPAVFSPSDAVNLPQYIYGAAILDAAGDLVGFSNFAEPLLLSHAGQQLHVAARVKFGTQYPVELEGYVE